MKMLSYRNEKNARFISAIYNKPLDKPDWYKIEAVSGDEADILLFDYIGWPYNEAGSFIRTLSELKQSKIVVRINSPGGDVFDANAIYNAIKSHPSKPITRVESLAASAASYILMAGSKKEAYKNAMSMIHDPATGLWGNQYEFRETADVLEQISGNMIDMYADNTNIGKREIKDMLKAETWMTAKVMKEKGFIDTIIETGKGAKAAFDLSMFANLPGEFRSETGNTEHRITERELEKALRDVYGLSQNKAKAILAGCKKADGDEDEAAKQAGINECRTALEDILSTFKR